MHHHEGEEEEEAALLYKGPCEECGSSDNLATYADGHSFCFTPGCGFKQGTREKMSSSDTDVVPMDSPGDHVRYTEDFMPKGLPLRRLSKDTLRRYGYFVNTKAGKSHQIAPYYNQKGQLALQKYRGKDKQFFFEAVIDNPPKPRMCQLFGQHVFGDKYDRRVVITGGELDAMSVAQATKFKVPAVSIPAGDVSAVDALKANYRWLDRFDEIILWMDNDESGQAVVEGCADLFEPGKVKTIKVEGTKDASELAQAGKEGEVYAAVYAATLWAPDGIVNASFCAADMFEKEGEVVAHYPYPLLEELTRGIRLGEVGYHVAGTGIGKTSIIVEMMDKMMKDNVKFGVMRFEDTRRKTQLDLMSLRAGRRLHLDPLPDEEMTTLHTQVFGGGLVELFDPQTARWDFEGILGYIRYMAKALDCKVIFIDPLSFIVAGTDVSDERKALDKVAYEFARSVKQSGVNLQITHHLTRPANGPAHEEGGVISMNQIRGSGGIAMFSMTIIGYERDQQGERPDLTRCRLLKNRFAGDTGVVDTLRWDAITGRQMVTDEPFPDRHSKDDSKPSFKDAGDY